jgi:hypothetical protein
VEKPRQLTIGFTLDLERSSKSYIRAALVFLACCAAAVALLVVGAVGVMELVNALDGNVTWLHTISFSDALNVIVGITLILMVARFGWGLANASQPTVVEIGPDMTRQHHADEIILMLIDQKNQQRQFNDAEVAFIDSYLNDYHPDEA